MSFEVDGVYNPETNIAVVTHAGEPVTREDLDRVYKVHLETWGSFDHRVYVISDIRRAAKVDYNRMSYHVSRIRKLRRERAAMTVMVADTVPSRFTAKLYGLVTGDSIQVVQTLDQAFDAIKNVQQSKGVIPRF